MLVKTNYCKKLGGVEIHLEYSLRIMMLIACADDLMQLSNEAILLVQVGNLLIQYINAHICR